jgi:hypothetical protein
MGASAHAALRGAPRLATLSGAASTRRLSTMMKL